MMGNNNRPKPGSQIKVEPIRRQEDINRIKALLTNHPRNLALFTLGINTNLRASDLIRITTGQITEIGPGESFELREKKTSKIRRITLNNGTHAVIQKWIGVGCLRQRDPIFRSQRGGRLTVAAVNHLVKGWCREIGLAGNYGSHTLRKTWGYHAWRAGIDLPRLMVIFNHSSQRQTLDYLCIQAEEIKDVYMSVEL